jgi:hypothetical protein
MEVVVFAECERSEFNSDAHRGRDMTRHDAGTIFEIFENAVR